MVERPQGLTVNNKGTMFSLRSQIVGAIMVRSVLEEAVALASLGLFLATVAVVGAGAWDALSAQPSAIHSHCSAAAESRPNAPREAL